MPHGSRLTGTFIHDSWHPLNLCISVCERSSWREGEQSSRAGGECCSAAASRRFTVCGRSSGWSGSERAGLNTPVTRSTLNSVCSLSTFTHFYSVYCLLHLVLPFILRTLKSSTGIGIGKVGTSIICILEIVRAPVRRRRRHIASGSSMSSRWSRGSRGSLGSIGSGLCGLTADGPLTQSKLPPFEVCIHSCTLFPFYAPFICTFRGLHSHFIRNLHFSSCIHPAPVNSCMQNIQASLFPYSLYFLNAIYRWTQILAHCRAHLFLSR